MIRGTIILAVIAALAWSTPCAAEVDLITLARARFPELVRLTRVGADLLGRRAASGDGNAMATLAEAYEFGFGELPVDNEAAILWMRRAASANVPGAAREADFLQFCRDYADLVAGAVDTMARAKLAEAGLKSGENEEADPDLVELAQLGFPDAQATLAKMYATGSGAARNPVAAARWYISAAAGGDVGSVFELGIMLRQGDALPRDAQAAAARFVVAWKGGIVAAAIMLGDMFLSGEIGLPDPSTARLWYEAGASRGDSLARQRLVWMTQAFMP